MANEFHNPKDLKPGQEISLSGIVQISTFGGTILLCSILLDGYIKLGEYSFTHVIPDDFNSTLSAVDAIDQQIERMKDKHQAELHKLLDQKAQLLQITYEGAEILDAVTTPQPQDEHERSN